ncbi:hypothetical protein MMC30_001657 [Trapelia coarctata]|nr:hypothetical protein [Trapelia coarctata]
MSSLFITISSKEFRLEEFIEQISRSIITVEGQEQSIPPSDRRDNVPAEQALNSRHLDIVYYSDTDTGVQPTACEMDVAHGYQTAIQSSDSSVGTKLVLCTDSGPHFSPFNISSSRPFIFARYCVTMTGTLALFPAIKSELRGLIDDRVYTSIQQNTDWEYFGALYVTELIKCCGWETLSGHGDFDAMWDSLQQTVDQIVELQQKASSGERPANRLNIVVTDGVELIAVRFCNDESEQPPELYYSEIPEAGAKGTQEDREKEGELERRILIASKRMVDGPGEWNQVSENQAALVFMGRSVCLEDSFCRQEWISTSTSNLS